MVNVELYRENIENEQHAFREVLRRYFSGAEMDYYNPRILDICCGSINEEPILFEYFGSESDIISIDWNERFESMATSFGRKTFVLGDVRYLEKHVDGKFDIVIGRNVPLNPNRGTFTWIDLVSGKIFHARGNHWPETIGKLALYMHADSVLFLTFVRDDEFLRAEMILEDFRYPIKVAERNPITVPSSYIGVAGGDTKDDFIIIARPPKNLQTRLSWA